MRSANGLAAWAAAWDSGPSDLFRPALHADARVRVLAAHRGGTVVAGAAVYRGEQGVAGVSNLFAADGDLDDAWAGVLDALPGEHVVGYAQGPALDAALRLGFTTTGALRVWLYPG